jgi:hypothetical protein
MFYCQFCDYQSERSSIHYHHIIPKENGGSDQDKNRVYLCPNHHNKIFCSTAKSGIHSIKQSDSIEIIGWFSSSDGVRVLQYIENNKEIYIDDKNI